MSLRESPIFFSYLNTGSAIYDFVSTLVSFTVVPKQSHQYTFQKYFQDIFLVHFLHKMVYLHFPSNLTEEELMLQAKYQKLKKKVC